MATQSSVVLNYTCEDGKEKNFTFQKINDEVRTVDLKALADAIVNNKSIFDPVPITLNIAKTVIKTENEFDLSD